MAHAAVKGLAVAREEPGLVAASMGTETSLLQAGRATLALRLLKLLKQRWRRLACRETLAWKQSTNYSLINQPLRPKNSH